MHLMDEVERLCSRLTLLHRGRTLIQGELDDVKQQRGSGWIGLEVSGDTGPIERHPWVLETAGVGRSLEVRLEPGRDPSDFLRDVAPMCRIRRFEVRAPSLHSIFVRLVGAAESGDGAAPGDAPRPVVAAGRAS
jgi:ABC-2 type transport system ATP-binding protein